MLYIQIYNYLIYLNVIQKGCDVLENKIKNPLEQKHIQTKEMVFYLAAIFFYTMMTGMVGSYRQAYLVNVLRMADNEVSFYNGFLSVAGFLMSFVYALIIDNRKIGKKGKFIPIVNAVAIPMGIVTMLLFYTPDGLAGTLLMIYLIISPNKYSKNILYFYQILSIYSITIIIDLF